MENIKLENGRTIEFHYGINVDKAPALLARQDKGEGFSLSELDIREYGTKYFETHPQIINNYHDSITLSATKRKIVKVALPYDNSGSRILTNPVKFGLSLMDARRLKASGESLVNYGVGLDIDDRWGKYETWKEKDGIYTRDLEDWFEKDEEGNLIGLNKDMKEEFAQRCPIILTKSGHPDYVDEEFWMYKGERNKSIDGVQDLIHGTFKLGKSEHGYDTMMGQYLPDVSDKGVLKAWYVYGLDYGVGSDARARLDDDDGRFAFDSVGDAKADAEGVDVDKTRSQLQSLEGMLKSGQIDQIGSALDERDQLRERLLTTDQIYSVIGDYIGSANEDEVRKAIDELLKQ